jgi:alpha-L-rhamnosidase
MLVETMFVESKTYPLGVDVANPALGWSCKSEPVRSQMQTAYRIVVSDNEESIRNRCDYIWDSGKVTSRKSVHILYVGPPLRSRSRYYWQVQIWDADDQMTESQVSWWEMGLLNDREWSARWISGADEELKASKALPLFRHEFRLEKPVAKARAYICGLGQFELRLNGNKVGENVLEPGWTHYDKTCLYCTYDITGEVSKGANTVGIMLGNGFFNVTGGRYKKFKGSFGTPRCLVQLEITYSDGTSVTVSSSQSWRTSAGPITFSCIYGGEDYDACREQTGWDQPGFSENVAWCHAVEVAAPTGKLKSQALSPLKVMKTFKPITITQPSPGVFVADFGQNFSGWVEIAVTGPKGAQVILSPAELLKDNGTANQKWTGSPTRFNYVLGGNGVEVWSPRFSYSGFRYMQIEGAIPTESPESRSDSPILLRIEGQMIYPDTKVTGSFGSSDALLNRTHEIINWAILSNMKSIFTDCPHREKLGWLEQIHLMGPSVAYNTQIEPLLTKTMEDIRDAQQPNGMVPTTAPEYVVFSEQWRCFRDSVSWGAAYVLTGWNLLRLYGNSRILTEHYEGMKAYVDYVTAFSDHLIVTGGLGDWYDVNDDGPGFAKNTPIPHTETAMFYHMVDVFTQIASLLNNRLDAVKYGELRDKIKAAFNGEYFNRETLEYASGSQTSNAMPLVLGLVDDAYRESVLTHLIEDIQRRGYHTTAGDVGHRYVLLALAQNGRSDIIYEMTRNTDYPSYGYQIVHGATTLTEAWDGPTVGKSQNHFMLGHLEEWLYLCLAGIDYRYDPSLEAYKLMIKPVMLGDLEEVTAEHHLPVGCIRVKWNRSSQNQLMLNVDIPANCTGDVYVPTSSLKKITENGTPIEAAQGIEYVRSEAGYAILSVSSGQYRFVSTL